MVKVEAIITQTGELMVVDISKHPSTLAGDDEMEMGEELMNMLSGYLGRTVSAVPGDPALN